MKKPLDFPGSVFGLPREGGDDTENQMVELTLRFGHLLGRHAGDRVLDGRPG